MSTHYHVYGNTGIGDAVDYSTILATVSALTWNSPALLANSRWTFAVRAFDTVSTLEESNLDARVSIDLDASRVDITGVPNPPTGLTAKATAAASARVSWTYNPGDQGGAPTGFKVYKGTPAVSYASVAATVAYVAGSPSFSATLAGLVDGSTYQVGVRSFNLVATETNVDTATFVADATGPSQVPTLTATVIA